MVWGGGGAGMGGAFVERGDGRRDRRRRVRRRRACDQPGRSSASDSRSPGLQGQLPAPFGYALPFGLMSPAQMFALPARRHMAVYGTTTDHFAEVSINARRNAATNPDALFRTEITVEDHHNSRMIADPLRLFDICMESDGAGGDDPHHARARPRPAPAAGVRAWARRWPAATGGARACCRATTCPTPTTPPRANAPRPRRSYRLAGVGPDDIDVAEIYDHFTPLVLMGLEDFGFCKHGRERTVRRRRQHPPRGLAAGQHPRRQPRRGVPPRRDARARGRPPTSRHGRQPDRRGRGRARRRRRRPDALRLDDPEEVTS